MMDFSVKAAPAVDILAETLIAAAFTAAAVIKRAAGRRVYEMDGTSNAR